jgi:type II secretory pathway component PulC
MDRSFKEITLPISKDKVQLYTYYLRGDRIAIRQIMTEAVVMGTDGKPDSVDVSYELRMQDEEVLRAIKSIKRGEESVEPSKEYVLSLAEEDYDFVRDNLPKAKGAGESTMKQSEDSSEKPRKSEESNAPTEKPRQS